MFKRTLYLITANGIFKLTAKRDLEDFITAVDEKIIKGFFEDSFEKSEDLLSSETITSEFDWSVYFLEQYKKEIDDNEDKLLVFFKVDYTKGLIKELGELRKVTPVVVVFPFHAIDAVNSYPELALYFPLHQLLFFPFYLNAKTALQRSRISSQLWNSFTILILIASSSSRKHFTRRTYRV